MKANHINDKITLNTLLNFVPGNEEESKLFDINLAILSHYSDQITKSPSGVYYLYGDFKRTADDEIKLSEICELEKLHEYNIDTANMCNSWELISLHINGSRIHDIKRIVKQYIAICELREKNGISDK